VTVKDSLFDYVFSGPEAPAAVAAPASEPVSA
jgi:hypothetical protein